MRGQKSGTALEAPGQLASLETSNYYLINIYHGYVLILNENDAQHELYIIHGHNNYTDMYTGQQLQLKK